MKFQNKTNDNNEKKKMLFKSPLYVMICEAVWAAVALLPSECFRIL